MDEDVFAPAASEDRVLVSEDAGFGTLLATRDAPRPPVILFRHMPDRRATALLAILHANLTVVEADLNAGALVVTRGPAGGNQRPGLASGSRRPRCL